MNNIDEVLEDARHFPEMGGKVVEKLWGKEFIICRAPHAAKIMVMDPDTQVSLHWHKDKSETFILIEGELVVETINTKTGETIPVNLYSKFSSITLQPNTPHTFYCPEGQIGPTVFIEASTEDRDDDSYRIFPSQGKEDLDNRGSNSR